MEPITIIAATSLLLNVFTMSGTFEDTPPQRCEVTLQESPKVTTWVDCDKVLPLLTQPAISYEDLVEMED